MLKKNRSARVTKGKIKKARRHSGEKEVNDPQGREIEEVRLKNE